MSSFRSGTEGYFGGGAGPIAPRDACETVGEAPSAGTTLSRRNCAYPCSAASAFLNGRPIHQVNSGSYPL